MTNEDELQPTVLLYVLGLLDHQRWAAKAGIVSVIGSQEGGDWLSANDVGLLTGMSDGRARRLLRELEVERVIFRAAGGGCQPFWVRVNPDVLGWRNVPWKIEPAELAARLAFHEEHSRAATTPVERFNARPRGARRRDFFARARAARQQIEQRRSTRAPGGTGERLAGVALRAPQGARVPVVQRAPQGVPANGAGSSIGVSTAGADPQSVIAEPAGTSGATATEEDAHALDQARRVVLSRSAAGPRGRFLNGEPMRRLQRMVAAEGPERIKAIAGEVPANEYQVPVFLDQVEAALAGEVETGGCVDAAPGHASRVLDLHTRIDVLAAQIATWEELGDDEEADRARSELAACENELQTIGGAQ